MESNKFKKEKSKQKKEEKKAKMSQTKELRKAFEKEEEEKLNAAKAKADEDEKSLNDKINAEIDAIEKKEKDAEDAVKAAEEAEKAKIEKERKEKLDKSTLKFKEWPPVKEIQNEDYLTNREGFKISRQADFANGQLAKLYKATDKEMLNMVVKIVVLGSHKPNTLQKLADGLKITSYIKANPHPNVVTIYECYNAKDRFWIFQEILLEDLKNKVKSATLDEAATKKIAKDVAEGLNHLHSIGIAHRNLSPDNVLVSESGVAKIAGFSLTTIYWDALKQELIKSSKAGDHHPHYSPERTESDHDPSKADVWAFGCLIPFMMCGKQPFEHRKKLEKYSHDICWKLCYAKHEVTPSTELRDLLALTFEMDPEKRPPMHKLIKDVWLTS